MNKGQKTTVIVKDIIYAAREYKKNLVGQTFLYVFEGHNIEVVYRAKDFLHLTGVDTKLPAKQFYHDAVNGILQPAQIFFSPRHPIDLCIKKMSQLKNLSKIVSSDLFMLEGLTTNSFTFKFGVTDLALTLCLSQDMDLYGQVMSNNFIARSLRVEDDFGRSTNAYEIEYIFAKKNDERKYNKIMYADDRIEIKDLPDSVLDFLDDSLKATN